MDKIKSFRDLIVWQKSADLAVLIYHATEKFSRSELYGITNQMRRCVISISSNVAEGFKRIHKKEKIQFYYVAYGSAVELESQIEISRKLTYLAQAEYQDILGFIIEISKMLDGLIKSISRNSTALSFFPFFFLSYILTTIFYPLSVIHADTLPSGETRIVNLNAATLNAAHGNATLFFSPRMATILEGSTFEVPVFINTHGVSINTLELRVTFDPNKLIIVRPSGNKSIIALWLEPPAYSNTEGTVRLVGLIPNGIITESGLITAMTFRAMAPGETQVVISSQSQVLANDGLGSKIVTEFDRGRYTILTKPPDGVTVFSETHPFQEQWYNNNNPIIAWEKPPGISDFSFLFDTKPLTIPDNSPESNDTTIGYQNVADGLWYFHIKAHKKDTWGATTHFLVRIDTTAPAAFQPKVEALSAAIISKFLISFFTTDALSGLDHYEIGAVNRVGAASSSPFFIQSESPYQLAPQLSGNMRVVVRAFDRAGNVQEGSVDVMVPLGLLAFLKNNWIIILLVLLLIAHYFFGHRFLFHIKRIINAIKKEEEKIKDEEKGVSHGEDTLKEPRNFL